MEACGAASMPVADPPFGDVGTLRVAVTDGCDLRCAYCRPLPESRRDTGHGLADLGLLRDQIAWLHRRSRLAKIKLTGGEPLLHPRLEGLVARLAELRPRPELSLTTNGTRLAGRAADLRARGLDRVTVSLDTLDPDAYRHLTGGDVERVLGGLEAARRAGLAPRKINAVLRRSTWRDDVPSLLDLAAADDLEVRFIELMQTGTDDGWCRSERVPAREIREALRDRRADAFDGSPHPDGASPARIDRLRWRGREVRVGWIEPVSHPFCGRCDRLRLHADGSLARCLMDPIRLDLPRVRREAGERCATRIVRAYLDGKRPAAGMTTASSMAQLGG